MAIMKRPQPHSFNRSLEWSEQASHEPFWDAVYRKAFSNLVSHMPTPGDFQSQRMGIDRSILLANGKTLYVDEKKRSREYGDILLEYISVDTTNTPGWIEKDLAIDYLAYAFMQSQRCYLFSWPLLRRAWQMNRDAWFSRYEPIIAQNKGYHTHCLPIPIPTLQRAVAVALVIDLQDKDAQL